MKSKIAIVIEREFMIRVKSRVYLIMTLLGPLFLLLVMAAPTLFMMWGGNDSQVVAVLDHTGIYKNVLSDTKDYKFVPATESISEYRNKAKDATVSGVLEIRQDLREDPKAMTLFSFKTLPPGVENYINDKLSSFVTNQKLRSHNVEGIEEIVRDSETHLAVQTFKVGDDGEEVISSGSVSMILGIFLAMLIYMYISIFGTSVLNSVMEEKKSRIMEVIVSSVKPFDLMMGKIIGVGAVGLTQIIIWGIILVGLFQVGSSFFLSSVSEAGSAAAMGAANSSGIDIASLISSFSSLNFVEIVVCFVLYFIGGFLLYSTLFAALGSAVSSDEDAQGLMWPISVILLLSFYAGFACMNAPDSTLAHVASYIPFSAPVVMMIRIPYGVAVWEEILSMIVLYGSFVALTFVSAKIYRIGVLMYGKNTSLKELWRWLRD